MTFTFDGKVIGEVVNTEGGTITAHITAEGAKMLREAGDFGTEYRVSYRADLGCHRFEAAAITKPLGMGAAASAPAEAPAEDKPKRTRKKKTDAEAADE